MKWITNTDPIRTINTMEVKLSEKEIQQCVVNGMKSAYKLTSNPCITVIELEIFKAVRMACNRPKIK
jgi:hypothetical protein